MSLRMVKTSFKITDSEEIVLLVMKHTSDG